MALKIETLGPECLAKYREIPIAFEVRSVLEWEVRHQGMGGIALRERPVSRPYVKDYDAYDGGPEGWGKRFDISNFTFFLASLEAECVAGAVVVHNAPDVDMLGGRKDTAALWDIRVRPHLRRSGIGGAVFESATGWSRDRGCSLLKIETQNVNVPACRFYAGRGCELGKIDLHAYAGDQRVAHEAMLIWYLVL